MKLLDRVNWLMQVMDDGTLPSVSYRTSSVLCRQCDNGDAVDGLSQRSLMDAMSMSRGGVQKALRKLVANGHLTVEVKRGRGATNHYRPILAPSKNVGRVAECRN